MKSSPRAFVVCVMCCAAGVFSAFGVNGTFNGVDGSGSGDISAGDNWSTGSVPDGEAYFQGQGGELTASAPVSLPKVYFRGTALSWVLRDFGSNVTISQLLSDNKNSPSVGTYLLLTNGTLTVSSGVKIGGTSCASNVVEVGKGATLNAAGGILIGGQQALGFADAPGNTLLVSEGGALTSSGAIRLGQGSSGAPGNTRCRLEARGAKSVELTGTSGNLMFDGAYGEALFADTERVAFGGQVSVGNILSNCTFAASNVTELSVGGYVYVKNGSTMILQDVESASFASMVRMNSRGSVRIAGVTNLTLGNAVAVGESANDAGRMEIVDVDTVTLTKGVDVKFDSSAEIRNVRNWTSAGGNVAGGSSLVMSNLTSVTLTSDFMLGSDTLRGSTTQMFMPPDFNPYKIRVANSDSAELRSLVYGAGGAVLTNTALTSIVRDEGKKNVSVEFRDGEFFLYNSGNTIKYLITSPNHTYVIGRGMTLTVPETKAAPAFSQEGQAAAYGNRVDGVGIVVDGGMFRLPSANGTYAMGRVDRGEAGVFQVVNDGLLWADANFIVGEGSGIADSCAVRVASGGQIKADGFYIKTSNNRTVISNGTVAVASCCWPPSGCKYPNNDYFGDKKNTPRDVTNNVIRVEGAASRLVATGGIYAEQDDGQIVETILEFAVPEGGYDEANPPIQAGEGMAFHGKLTLRVDPTAYTGCRRWMTVMKTASGVISSDDLNLSELPADVKVRFLDGGKLLQIKAGKPLGFLMTVW